jgi:VanZ family protein
MGRNARAYYDDRFGRDRSVSAIVGILEAAGHGGNGGGNGQRNSVHWRTGAGRMPRMTDAQGQRRPVSNWVVTIFQPKRLAVAVGGLLVVLVSTHIPQAMMPKQLSGNIIDKAEHAVAHGVIALLFLLAFRRPPGGKALLVLLLAGAAVGALDELTQPLVNRIASVADFVADVVGIALVVGIYWVTQRCRRSAICY